MLESAVHGELDNCWVCRTAWYVKSYGTSWVIIQTRQLMCRKWYLISLGQSFALLLFVRIEVDREWPWNILQPDKAYFNLQFFVDPKKLQYISNWESVPAKVVSLSAGKYHCSAEYRQYLWSIRFFIKDNLPAGPVTCTSTGKRYEAFMHIMSCRHFTSVSVWIAQYS